ALNDVVESGKVRYIGASSMAAWQFQALQNVALRNGWHQFISMQNFYNLLEREEEREMIPPALGLSSTLREKTNDAIINLVRGRETSADRIILQRVDEVAKRKGISMAQVSLAWTLSHPGTNPVVGMNTKECIDEAVASIHVHLTYKEVTYLEDAYVPKRL
ncbi:hypothetical protein ABHI18_011876, partial [Aspergillus niger]